MYSQPKKLVYQVSFQFRKRWDKNYGMATIA